MHIGTVKSGYKKNPDAGPFHYSRRYYDKIFRNLFCTLNKTFLSNLIKCIIKSTQCSVIAGIMFLIIYKVVHLLQNLISKNIDFME